MLVAITGCIPDGSGALGTEKPKLHESVEVLGLDDGQRPLEEGGAALFGDAGVGAGEEATQ